MDNLELRAETQEKIEVLWPQVTEENLYEISDYKGYNADFLRLFGFGFDGVDYQADISPEVEVNFQ